MCNGYSISRPSDYSFCKEVCQINTIIHSLEDKKDKVINSPKYKLMKIIFTEPFSSELTKIQEEIKFFNQLRQDTMWYLWSGYKLT